MTHWEHEGATVEHRMEAITGQWELGA